MGSSAVCAGLVWNRLGSVVCGLCGLLMVWALRLSGGLWACLVGSGGLAYGLGLSGLWWALWACQSGTMVCGALVGFHWTLGPAAVSAHFVFTCKKTRIESGRF